jgi:hypothetical protein
MNNHTRPKCFCRLFLNWIVSYHKTWLYIFSMVLSCVMLHFSYVGFEINLCVLKILWEITNCWSYLLRPLSPFCSSVLSYYAQYFPYFPRSHLSSSSSLIVVLCPLLLPSLRVCLSLAFPVCLFVCLLEFGGSPQHFLAISQAKSMAKAGVM